MTTSVQSIAEQVARFNDELAGQAPAEVLAPFRSEQVDLDAAGLPESIAAVGTAMPDGDLLDAHGNATTLRQSVGDAPSVVVFYRGAWCPYCNIALKSYQRQVLPSLRERGVSLIAVSPQKPDASLSAQETNELEFSVLSDPGNQIATQLGILTHPNDGARKSQQALGIDVAGSNIDGTDNVAMPTVVLVDPTGVIRWIDVHPNYTTRTEPADILNAVAGLLNSSEA
jgi:peroxiredoxin